MKKEMTKILDCSAGQCAYNKGNQCHAMAINVGRSEPRCDTFESSMEKGGVSDMTGGVGACKVISCQYNDSLECGAQGIHMDMKGGRADCSTYKMK